jgi:hypothetical protein
VNKAQNKTRITNLVKFTTLCAVAMPLLTTATVATALETNIGGYVKVDAIYDLDADMGPSLDAPSVPTGPGATSDPSFRMHALQSRFNITATEGDLKIFTEVDFSGGDGTETVSNSAHIRLRHAYGQMGNMLAGQTWSTFMDANWLFFPTTVDFAGSAGATFVRQAQFRWTIDEGLDFAVENPESVVRGAPASRDSLPDVVLRYAKTGDVSWQVAGVFQQFSVDGGPADGETESNLGLSAGINFKLADGKDSVSIQTNLNSNRYTYYGFSNPSAVVSGSSIELIDHTAVVTAYNHDWGDAKTTIAYGLVSFDDAFLGATDIDNVSTLHINYRWSPYTQVDYLAELSRATQELVNGDDGDAIRLQFAVQYNF